MGDGMLLGASILAKKIGISRQALHRRLKLLVESGQIKKIGSGPRVVYGLNSNNIPSRITESFEHFMTLLLPQFLKKNKKTIQSNYKAFLRSGHDYHGSKKERFAFMLDLAALFSSKIEGNSLNFNSFFNSRTMTKKIRPKEAQEIEDLIEAYQLSEKRFLNEKNMLTAHQILSRSFVSKARQGCYRQEPVGVFSRRGIEYLAIEPHFLTHEMRHFFAKIDTLKHADLTIPELFFWASWVHLMMVLIHPFSDGNGRIARVVEKWFLKQHIGPSAYFLNSEEYYFLNKPAYYRSLKLGVNYWEVDFNKAADFLTLLPGVLLLDGD